jgi:predicted O-methyltransferase YrrM
MGRIAASISYARDVSEVLILQRVRSSPIQSRIAGEAATVVRQARFHAHARIPDRALNDILPELSLQPVAEVTLPGPTERDGVGGAAYYHALASVVRAVRPKSVLEFGTFLGLGTLTMALNAPDDCRIVTVDLPDDAAVDDGHALNPADLELIERRRHRTGEAFQESRVADRITQVRADSLTWEPPADLGPFDLVLIDGGHSTPVVRADTENAFHLLAPGGTVLWDDYFHLYPDVVGYLDGVAGEGRRLQAIRGTNLVLFSDSLK